MFDAGKTRIIGLPYGEKIWQYVKPFNRIAISISQADLLRPVLDNASAASCGSLLRHHCDWHQEPHRQPAHTSSMTGAEANVSNLHCSLEQQEHVTNEYNLWKPKVDYLHCSLEQQEHVTNEYNLWKPKVDYQIKQDEWSVSKYFPTNQKTDSHGHKNLICTVTVY